MLPQVKNLPVRPSFAATSRPDRWWIQPAITFVVFSGFIVYATWAALEGQNYHHGGLLSPFYSPELWGAGTGSHHGLFGDDPPSWWPRNLLGYSPAILILWAPVSFRLTCYYYRGAYYKAFWADPPACSVGEPRKRYLGERHFPLIIQNIHRYTLPFALLLLVFLSWDVWRALWFEAAPGAAAALGPQPLASIVGAGGAESGQAASAASEFGLSVGTLVLAVNVSLLGLYTMGCHSLRHLIGGGLDVLSRRPLRKKAYNCVTWCNKSHMRYAWASLLWVAFADLYVRLCATGVLTDLRIL